MPSLSTTLSWHHVAFGFADVGDGAFDRSERDVVLAHEALSRELVLRFGGSQRGPVVSPGRRAGGHGLPQQA